MSQRAGDFHRSLEPPSLEEDSLPNFGLGMDELQLVQDPKKEIVHTALDSEDEELNPWTSSVN